MNIFDDNDDYFLNIQRQINSLVAWMFEGFVGRAMMDAIDDGRCCLGLERTTDYWGNTLPGRDDVQAGTKGSLAYVAERYGQDWADQIASVEVGNLAELFHG
jgi:hypothetical protein